MTFRALALRQSDWELPWMIWSFSPSYNFTKDWKILDKILHPWNPKLTVRLEVIILCYIQIVLRNLILTYCRFYEIIWMIFKIMWEWRKKMRLITWNCIYFSTYNLDFHVPQLHRAYLPHPWENFLTWKRGLRLARWINSRSVSVVTFKKGKYT